MSAHARNLPVVIYVVDDVAADAVRYAEVLERCLRSSATAFFAAELRVDIRVLPLYPTPTEFADDFEARFEKIVCLQEEATKEDSLRLQAVLFDLAFSMSARQGGVPTSGERLAALSRRWRPSVARYGLTSLPLARTKTPLSLLKTPFKKEQLHTDASASPVAREILADLRSRLETPIWTGLLEFSKLSKVSMHAMASSEARQSSLVVDPFLDLLGSNYYQIEATSTKFPLDSLLTPKGPIKRSQALLASSFGAYSADLVTNGTSTANKIVYASLLKENDYVLIDRCCHISHHHAIAVTGANAIYIEPESSPIPGVPAQILTTSVQNALRLLLEHHPKSALPKIISITNCTFDGFLIEPASVIMGVLDVLEEFDVSHRLREITFLFDEAWFSFGYFHPAYTQFSAMGAASELKSGENGAFWQESLNIIATQSLHKTGFALRQASVILKHFGNWALAENGGEVERRFQSSVRMFSTTSPSMPILASIDWARRQLDLEGTYLVDLAHEGARVFTEMIEEAGTKGAGIYVHPTGPSFHDQTKVTLRSRTMAGTEIRDKLWGLSQVKVQINKFSTDSVLLMFMPGFSDRSCGLLMTAFSEFIGANATDDKCEIDFSSLLLPPLDALRFVGRDGDVCAYPEALTREDGFQIRRGLFCEFDEAPIVLPLDDKLEEDIAAGGTFMSQQFVTPYPPGFPILLPGQVLSISDVRYLRNLQHGEVHGLIESAGGPALSAIRLTANGATSWSPEI